MPSVLVIPGGETDLSSTRYSTTCCGTGQEKSYIGDRSVRHFIRGGYPTPPVTTNMTAMSIPRVDHAYYEQHPYLNEQQVSNPNHSNQRVVAQPTQGKAQARESDTRICSRVDGHLSTSTQHYEEQIASYLQIPESVNSSKGSLAEFAAEITCLFWFETSATIEYAESLPVAAVPNRGLTPDAIPSIGFRKWATTLLSTTQVGRNVILLALMFIHRLKKFNPSVSGKRGSEFRLLTIALMLGNKFLDDNTYTNKTWADVSGIPVKEIHVMEVEFLSNMRYELYASEADWLEWKTKLGKFGAFYEKALRCNSSRNTSPTTPTTQLMPYKLPSPPSGSRHTNGNYANLPNPLHTLANFSRSPAKHYSGMEYPFERKRSLDTSSDLPPAKRVHSALSTKTNMSPLVLTPLSAMTPNSSSSVASYEPARFPQLPKPTLPHPVNRGVSQLAPLSLPGPRAMSAIYPSTVGFSQPLTPTTAGPSSTTHMPLSSSAVPSPSSRVTSHAGSAQTSPNNLFGGTTPTRPGLSPSYFLMNRSSPYRPVRHVNTLLYPPPSGAIQDPVRSIDYHQMHYQPLSKHTNQLRSGQMPSLQPEPWQNHISTQTDQPYRSY